MKKIYLFVCLTTLLSVYARAQDCEVTIQASDNGDGTSTLTANGSGSGDLYYSWDDGSQTQQITVPNDGTQMCVYLDDYYTESVYVGDDANGDPIYEDQDQTCSSSDCVTLPNAVDCSGFSVSIQDDPNNSPDGLVAIASGANGNVYYQWSPTGETSDAITVDGTTVHYDVYVEDDAGCTATDGYDVTYDADCSGVSVTISDDPNNAPDGLIAVATGTTGNVAYEWTPTGETTDAITVDGTTVHYDVKITDDNGCTATDGYDVTYDADCSGVSVSIGDDPNNTEGLLATATGTTGNVAYEWSPNGGYEASMTVDGESTHYEVTITDDNGCTATNSYDFTYDNCADVTVTADDDPNNAPDGIIATVTNGTGAITYTWTPGNISTQGVTVDGTTVRYDVIITDANGCTATDFYDVEYGTPCSVSITTKAQKNPGTGADEWVLTATGTGTGAFQYQWDSEETTQSITVAEEGEMCVYIVDDSGCEADTCIQVTAPGSGDCDVSWDMAPEGSGYKFTAVVPKTLTNLTYKWDFGDGKTSTLQNPSHTFATDKNAWTCLTIDNGAGCHKESCDSIVDSPTSKGGGGGKNPKSNGAGGAKPDKGATNPTNSTCTASFTSVADVKPTFVNYTFTPSVGGTASGYTYKWDFGDGTAGATTIKPIHKYLKDGTYTVTLTIKNKTTTCTKTVTTQVTVKRGITTSISSSDNNDALINVYPNPFTDMLNIELENSINENLLVTIYDVQGKLVESSKQIIKAGENKIVLNTGELAEGVYTIRLNASDFVNTYKVVKY